MLNPIFSLTALLCLCLSSQAPGTYSGTWSSGSSGNSGKLNFTVVASGLESSSFTIEGQEIKAKPISWKTDSNAVDFTFEYELDSGVARSRLRRTVEGKSIKGKYTSLGAGGGDPIDEGTWEVTKQ